MAIAGQILHKLRLELLDGYGNVLGQQEVEVKTGEDKPMVVERVIRRGVVTHARLVTAAEGAEVARWMVGSDKEHPHVTLNTVNLEVGDTVTFPPLITAN